MESGGFKPEGFKECFFLDKELVFIYKYAQLNIYPIPRSVTH